MEFEPMLTPREKSPLPENVPRGASFETSLIQVIGAAWILRFGAIVCVVVGYRTLRIRLTL